MLRQLNKGNKGFTIIELLLASAVFSVTLLIAINGFLQIGRLFYKGVSNTQTSTITRQIVNELSRNLQVSPEVSTQQSANGYFYYCLGNSRYTYTRGPSGEAIMADLSSPDYSPGTSSASAGNFGLLKDTLSGSNACASPCDPDTTCPSGSVPFNNPVELLGNKMRLGALAISSAPSSPENLYNITVMVIYGDDDVLEYSRGASDPTSAECKGGSSPNSSARSVS